MYKDSIGRNIADSKGRFLLVYRQYRKETGTVKRCSYLYIDSIGKSRGQ